MEVASGDVQWVEAFEDALLIDEQLTYLQAAQQLLDAQVTEEMLEADPLILLEAVDKLSVYKLDILIRTMRHYRWRSRRFYDKVCSSREQLIGLMETQDLVLLRALFASMAKLLNSDPKSALDSCRIVCYLINSILLEAPHLLKTILLSMNVPPEALPVSFEFIPMFHSVMDFLPELLAKDTTHTPSKSYKLYFVDVAAWLALKYPSRRFEPILVQISGKLNQVATSFDSHLQALTIGTRLCLALPQMALEPMLPLLEGLNLKAELSASMKRESGVAYRKALSSMEAVFDARGTLESRYIYNKTPTCITTRIV